MKVIYDNEGKVLAYANGEVLEVTEMPMMQFQEGYTSEYAVNLETKEVYTKLTQLPKSELELLREELALTKEMATVAVEAIASMNEEVI